MPKRSDTDRDEDLVGAYLREIGRFALIDADEEVALARAIEAGVEALADLDASGQDEATRSSLEERVADGERAKRAFVEANLRLVVSIARRYQGHGSPLLDLIQDGNIGLMRAVDGFEWRRGLKFSTYATWWIRQGISRGLVDSARTIRLPVHVAEVVNRVRNIEGALALDLGREPTDDELARAAGVDADRLDTYRMLGLGTVSLSTTLGVEGDTELHEMLEDEHCESPLDAAVRAGSTDELRAVLGTLPERERRIVELRFGLTDGHERTLEQVGREFNLTRERIRQLEAKAIAKLRHPIRIAALEGLRE